jgi:hypothetical protein
MNWTAKIVTVTFNMWLVTATINHAKWHGRIKAGSNWTGNSATAWHDQAAIQFGLGFGPPDAPTANYDGGDPALKGVNGVLVPAFSGLPLTVT